MSFSFSLKDHLSLQSLLNLDLGYASIVARAQTRAWDIQAADMRSRLKCIRRRRAPHTPHTLFHYACRSVIDRSRNKVKSPHPVHHHIPCKPSLGILLLDKIPCRRHTCTHESHLSEHLPSLCCHLYCTDCVIPVRLYDVQGTAQPRFPTTRDQCATIVNMALQHCLTVLLPAKKFGAM